MSTLIDETATQLQRAVNIYPQDTGYLPRMQQQHQFATPLTAVSSPASRAGIPSPPAPFGITHKMTLPATSFPPTSSLPSSSSSSHGSSASALCRINGGEPSIISRASQPTPTPLQAPLLHASSTSPSVSKCSVFSQPSTSPKGPRHLSLPGGKGSGWVSPSIADHSPGALLHNPLPPSRVPHRLQTSSLITSADSPFHSRTKSDHRPRMARGLSYKADSSSTCGTSVAGGFSSAATPVACGGNAIDARARSRSGSWDSIVDALPCAAVMSPPASSAGLGGEKWQAMKISERSLEGLMDGRRSVSEGNRATSEAERRDISQKVDHPPVASASPPLGV